ncbi:DUF4349 domain-containing protein [Chitinophaga sp. 22321]|uniref:DUF4349 domain-containing protein n=1 Tax=Chitinophaga hostae TaxID=2831022 RepID=A0ABS5J1A2_9BACT|nr:DUF4349 domain-containing protein [Chitinophaga hostae]MBS0028964.1 DUF4349 domain-containing protein [Chitinophaga hostae]
MRPSLYYLMVPILGICACSSNNASMKEYAATADSTSFANDISGDLNSASRKRVKSADMRCRVPSVFTATSKLEHLVTGVGGIVVESTLQNESVRQFDLPYTSDSVKTIQLYTPTANLTLRVPVAYLDSVDQSLTGMSELIEHRVIKDQDMTLKYLANALKNEHDEQKAVKAEKAAAEKVVPAKNGTTLDVVQYKDDKEETVIDRRLNNLALLDDVAYSTVTVQLFQPQVADIKIILNPARLSRAGFGTELVTALRSGAEVLRNIFLFFVQIWPFLLAFVLGWIGYRKLILRSR